MSQDYNTPSSRKQRRSARGNRSRPVLITPANSLASTEGASEPAQSSVATSAIVVEPAVSPASVVAPSAPKGRRLPSFFSTLGRGSQEVSKDKQESDIAQARIARATRGKPATTKTAAVAAEVAKKDAASEHAAETKAAPSLFRSSSRSTGGFKTRYIIGMAIYLLVAQFVGYGVTGLFAANKIDTVLAQFVLFGGNVIIKTSTLVYLAVLIILLVVLARFDFLPRSFSAATNSSANKGGASRNSGANGSSDDAKAQPTLRQGVQGADDDLYREYRVNQRRKK